MRGVLVLVLGLFRLGLWVMLICCFRLTYFKVSTTSTTTYYTTKYWNIIHQIYNNSIYGMINECIDTFIYRMQYDRTETRTFIMVCQRWLTGGKRSTWGSI